MNDSLLIVVLVLGGAWLAIGLWDWAGVLYRWYKRRQATKGILAGKVPAGYGVIKTEQERLNKIDEAGGLAQSPKDRRIASCLRGIRERVSHIRYAGYVAGENDQFAGLPFDTGVKGTPHKKGSGEAKQWVRGYCMARNVTDIKQYYRAA